MNKVIIAGRMVRDAEVRYNNEMAIAKYTVAVDRRFKKDNEQSADFISCTSFGKAGEFVEKYCRKGTKLIIEGRLQTGSYTNKDGNKVYTTDVITENIEFAESKKSAPESQPDNEGFMPADIDFGELPFN